jgi:hypothetical protein
MRTNLSNTAQSKFPKTLNTSFERLLSELLDEILPERMKRYAPPSGKKANLEVSSKEEEAET